MKKIIKSNLVWVKKIRTCLVIPEGINDECLKLLQFSINVAKKTKT